MNSILKLIVPIAFCFFGCRKTMEKPIQDPSPVVVDAITLQPVPEAMVYVFNLVDRQPVLIYETKTDQKGHYVLNSSYFSPGANIWFSHPGYVSQGLVNISALEDSVIMKPYLPFRLSSENRFKHPARVWGSFTEDGFTLNENTRLDTQLFHHAPDTITIKIFPYQGNDTLILRDYIKSSNQEIKITR